MEPNEKKRIPAEDTIYDIVTRYPEIKARLLELSPRFQRLNTLPLFHTVAKFTSVKKAAAIANLSLREMLYHLNDTIGLREEYPHQEKRASSLFKKEGTRRAPQEKPFWWEQRVYFSFLDARGNTHPFEEITTRVQTLKEGEGLLVYQECVPYPVMDYLTPQEFEVYYEREESLVGGGIYKKGGLT
ncbi:MAG: DUF1858 domain-containing protein [Brevinematales bacterium]|nr:DUF1858 domain-containing protein [Brevinematales bacterium]